ncbi:hypothetical protein GWI33_012053, partial [Rhynchophorus ferrugineus]
PQRVPSPDKPIYSNGGSASWVQEAGGRSGGRLKVGPRPSLSHNCFEPSLLRTLISQFRPGILFKSFFDFEDSTP